MCYIGVHIGTPWPILVSDLCMAVMRPCVSLLWPLVCSGHMMLSEEYLEECPVQNGFGSTVDLTQEGLRWLQKAQRSDDCKMLLAANHELMALDRSQTRPELTLSASARFVDFLVVLCIVFHLDTSTTSTACAIMCE